MNTVERMVIESLVQRALDSGYRITIWDGEAYPGKDLTNRDAIMNRLGSTDEEALTFKDSADKVIGGAVLIYDNNTNGEEVIADYTDNEAMRSLVEGT